LAQGFADEAREALSWLPPSTSRSALLALPEFVLSRLY
jgi:all-trans-nonaprenyl-diphosphate synthase